MENVFIHSLLFADFCMTPHTSIMAEEIMHIESISQLHALMGFEKPVHPLISIIDVSKLAIGKEWIGVKMTMGLYSIALKDASCGMDYGRNHYDFHEGVLIFTGPNQVIWGEGGAKCPELTLLVRLMYFWVPRSALTRTQCFS